MQQQEEQQEVQQQEQQQEEQQQEQKITTTVKLTPKKNKYAQIGKHNLTINNSNPTVITSRQNKFKNLKKH